MKPVKWFALLWVLPVVLLLVAKLLPLLLGSETLFLRDVFNTHLEMKLAQAEALRQGYLPMLDVYRAGGQPLLGNPNAVPLYPDNLLYLATPDLWAFNAHFWLHLLLAPWAMFWLGRELGLSREGAWAAGVCYALSGYFLSNLSFYNLVAGVTLAPALGASAVALMARPGAGGWMVTGLLWALLLLAGDPLVAMLALLLAVALVLTSGRWRSLLPLVTSLLFGTLVAAPQWGEFLRILPLSYRGHWGYSPTLGTVASWDPRQVAEWFVPLIFGRPDLLGPGEFWGHRFHTDTPPYFFSLYPGLLALVLVAAAGRPRNRGERWAWGAVAAGLFFSLGRFNPLVRELFELLGSGVVRYPVKFWLPVAVGAAVLCGWGLERALLEGDKGAARRLGLSLLLLGTALLVCWGVLNLQPDRVEDWLTGLVPPDYPSTFAASERLRWAGLCFLAVVLVVLLAVSWAWARRRPRLRGAVLIFLHAGAQLLFLDALIATDEVDPYLEPPPLLEKIPADARLVHGAFRRLFGSSTLHRGRFPRNRTYWLERRAFFELYPFVGALWGRRYELNDSPEGLDSFLARIAREVVQQASDDERVRLLKGWGVSHLLLDRPLQSGAEARLMAQLPSFGHRIYLYELPRAVPEVRLVGNVVYAPHVNAAVSRLKDPAFDPLTTVVLAGEKEPLEGDRGAVRRLRAGPESLEAQVDSVDGGVLVIERAHLPLYRATVDGQAAAIEVANVHRMGVQVPPGRHRVRVWIDRRPLRWESAASAVGLLALLLGGRLRRRFVSR